MRVQGSNFSKINPYQKQMNQQHEIKQAKQQDKMEISSEGKALQEIEKTNEQRAEYIKDIKAKVEKGDYKIDHEAAAQCLAKYYKGDL
ncbi:flagellar biosynthesis anti-sigma factor FlgM [Halobacillus massiliensis]|uniref:flagellar biosynthesis anti-sigma factor FlgM n=1 Tax=Halobacillus massiliensis TaxID=1926286 RepID=UPI0009E636F0|nr:flagellar biosynthesis anti-sigma factor FlgM [Halobacillus massiliensis]